MLIQEACENKGTLPEFPDMYCLIVRHAENNLSPCWYDAKTDHFARQVSGQEVLRTDWQPFPEVKELPKREDCIHDKVCRYHDDMCALECGHFMEKQDERN